MSQPTEIIVPRDGIASGTQQPRAVHDPLAVRVLSVIGQTTTVRASEVEPGSALGQTALGLLVPRGHAVVAAGGGYRIKPEYANHWFADMQPCGVLVVLGPWPPADREQALREESAWLRQHRIPTRANDHAAPAIPAR